LFPRIILPVSALIAPVYCAKISLFRALELWRPRRFEAMQGAHGFPISPQSPFGDL
jgi:hypothetical protein